MKEPGINHPSKLKGGNEMNQDRGMTSQQSLNNFLWERWKTTKSIQPLESICASMDVGANSMGGHSTSCFVVGFAGVFFFLFLFPSFPLGTGESSKRLWERRRFPLTMTICVLFSFALSCHALWNTEHAQASSLVGLHTSSHTTFLHALATSHARLGSFGHTQSRSARSHGPSSSTHSHAYIAIHTRALSVSLFPAYLVVTAQA